MPIAFYTFEGHGMDSSGNNLHGTISGQTSTVSGVIGNALHFQYAFMALPNDTQLAFDANDSFSVSFWFKSAPVTTRKHFLGIIGTSAKSRRHDGTGCLQ